MCESVQEDELGSNESASRVKILSDQLVLEKKAREQAEDEVLQVNQRLETMMEEAEEAMKVQAQVEQLRSDNDAAEEELAKAKSEITAKADEIQRQKMSISLSWSKITCGRTARSRPCSNSARMTAASCPPLENKCWLKKRCLLSFEWTLKLSVPASK